MKFLRIINLTTTLLCVGNAVSRSPNVEETYKDDLVVNTVSGWLKGGIGGKTIGKNRTVYWFRSIPYAEPPVGDLRFEPPLPKRKWKRTLDVSVDSPECIQRFNITRGAEDCLYLKIYTTKLPKDQTKKQPVLVFIHGGAFIFGSPNLTESSPDYLLDEDVLIVAVQYRLGIFGFLTTGDLVVPGNNALRDIILALKWIKHNIKAFGGDPNSITINGQSAGAALVSYLLQTSHTKGLFNRAIMQSGTSLCLWAYFRKGREFAINIGKDLKLDTSDSSSFVRGLKSVDAETLLESQSFVTVDMLAKGNPRDGLLLGPVMEPEHEGAIFTRSSYDELNRRHFHDIPILLGHTSLEAYLNDIPGQSIVRINIGKDLKLDTSDSSSFVRGLKSVDAETLLESQSFVTVDMLAKGNPRDGLLLGPVMEPEHEGAIFTRSSYDELNRRHFHDIPILLGHTSLEAYLNDIPGILRLYLGSYDVYLSKLVPIDMHVEGLIESHVIGGAIKDKYFGNKLIAFSSLEFMEFVTDDQFERPIQETARLYSTQSPVYYYKFSYKGALFGVTDRTVDGVGHTEDLAYLFDFKHQGSEEDYLMRKRMVKLWTNFAKTGNPTPEKNVLLQNIIWPSNGGSSDLQCLIIDKDLEVVKNVDSEKMTFWRDLYYKYGSNFDTY